MHEKSGPSLPLLARVLYGCTNVVLFLAGLANLFVGTRAAFNESATVAATLLTAGLVLLFAATIDRFESLKGLGIEAKTRKLDQKIDQADEALRRVREIGEITGAALIELKSQVGRMGVTPGVRESIESANKIRSILKRLGSDDQTIEAVLEPWARTLCFDVALAATQPLRRAVEAKLQPLQYQRGLLSMAQGAATDPNLAQVNADLNRAGVFLKRLKRLHLLDLNDYPESFIALFEEAPLIDSTEREAMRLSTARFTAGMASLRDDRRLVDVDLWAETIGRERDS